MRTHFSSFCILLAMAAVGGCSPSQQPIHVAKTVASQAQTVRKSVVPRLSKWKVVGSFPHSPDAFTQGLLWHNGALYEGTGLEGRSELRRVDLKSGKVLQRQKLPKDVFGEGLVLSGNRLIQITWQSQRAFVFDLKSLKPQGEWKYEGEGWGLTTDGKELIMSDGSSQLSFRDPTNFKEKRRLDVTFNGKPLDQLNELEWINGEIWANIWQTDFIARINPVSGEVQEYLDCSGLLDKKSRSGKEDVLNGIAYDAQKKRIFLTGKLWPKLFEIQLQN